MREGGGNGEQLVSKVSIKLAGFILDFTMTVNITRFDKEITFLDGPRDL